MHVPCVYMHVQLRLCNCVCNYVSNCVINYVCVFVIVVVIMLLIVCSIMFDCVRYKHAYVRTQ